MLACLKLFETDFDDFEIENRIKKKILKSAPIPPGFADSLMNSRETVRLLELTVGVISEASTVPEAIGHPPVACL